MDITVANAPSFTQYLIKIKLDNLVFQIVIKIV